jgi:hypothetical protein
MKGAIMSLRFGNPRNVSYFVQQATIRGIQATYNNEVFGIVWDIDVSILLDVVKKTGETYEYTMSIRANYQKNDTGQITGFGSAFKVARLFERLGISGKINADGIIPEDYLQQVVNKSIRVLFYRTGYRENGNVKFQCWDIIDVDKNSLLAQFDESQLKGYPKNYLSALESEDDNSLAEENTIPENEKDELIF